MTVASRTPIRYPDSDGQPMADNTQQFRLIVLLKENLECLFADNPDVFVAGDLLWYPVEGKPEIRVAPDVFVVFGRPKGDRGSYRQWQEDNIAPQVVFEILSPGNTLREMHRKFQFYDRHGVEEYYLYDPDRHDFTGFVRQQTSLQAVEADATWVSPLLGIQFDWSQETLQVFYPEGAPFLTTVELKAESQRAQQQAEQEKQRAEQALQAVAAEQDRVARLTEQLRALGLEPDL
ncbi:MAG: Uma2 family endonuclease [Prochlorothrix sp.]